MLDNKKIAEFIVRKRKEIGMTQAEVAESLQVSFQAVSKWENGTLPNVEMLVELAKLLGVTVDEILSGQEKSEENFSYSKAGVDISYTDAMKKEMAVYLQTDDRRVLNGFGPFASLYDISFPEISNPVLVLKAEEPGSKQKLAMEYGYSESICHDMINHLVNDIAVMGAKPLAVASNGLHTNGYSLVRMLMDKMPQIKLEKVAGETFIEQIMKPHTPYYRAIKNIFGKVHGMAHITGGGIEGNLCRIIQEGLCAEIDLSKMKPLPIFSYIQKVGNIEEEEMLSTFNCGVGLMIVVPKEQKEQVINEMKEYYDCYEVGTIITGTKKIRFREHIRF